MSNSLSTANQEEQKHMETDLVQAGGTGARLKNNTNFEEVEHGT
jgi:hypothetical protein